MYISRNKSLSTAVPAATIPNTWIFFYFHYSSIYRHISWISLWENSICRLDCGKLKCHNRDESDTAAAFSGNVTLCTISRERENCFFYMLRGKISVRESENDVLIFSFCGFHYSKTWSVRSCILRYVIKLPNRPQIHNQSSVIFKSFSISLTVTSAP